MASLTAKRFFATTLESSASLLQARDRVFSFFKQNCRSLPKIMDMYNLHEVTTLPQLRSQVAAQFRKHADVKSPQIVDMLVFKGLEELENVLSHAKQRHHLLSQYVVGPGGMVKTGPLKPGISTRGESDFLKQFYVSNSV